MAAFERRSGISESIMSVLISTLQEPIVAGIVAGLTDIKRLPSITKAKWLWSGEGDFALLFWWKALKVFIKPDFATYCACGTQV